MAVRGTYRERFRAYQELYGTKPMQTMHARSCTGQGVTRGRTDRNCTGGAELYGEELYGRRVVRGGIVWGGEGRTGIRKQYKISSFAWLYGGESLFRVHLEFRVL